MKIKRILSLLTNFYDIIHKYNMYDNVYEELSHVSKKKISRKFNDLVD